MGHRGYPFPSTLGIDLEDEIGHSDLIRPDHSTSPDILSPQSAIACSPSFSTPGNEREPNILPSVISPVAVPGNRRALAAASPRQQHEFIPDMIRLQQAVSRKRSVQMLSAEGLSIAPAGASLPTPPQERRQNLRLPSFADLGIASCDLIPPTLDRVESGQVDMAMVTPPTDGEDCNWIPGISNISDLGGTMSPTPQSGMLLRGDASLSPVKIDSASATGAESSPNTLDDIMEIIVGQIGGQNPPSRSIRVLSHALPTPTVPGHYFPLILEFVKSHNSSSSLIWISHLHAVPSRFNVSDLPTSPPSTPGQPLGTSDGTGEDYFTVKVFESAVEAMDYSSFSEGLIARVAGGSPRASFQQELAAPSSLNLIVVERYIPPSSTKEFSNLFSLSKPSLLVDRLFELVPGNGCLAFIYPTRTGARTFADKILGPIIDPLLRGMSVVKGFSADLSKAIGTMTAVPQMYEFESLKWNVDCLCEEIRSTANSSPALRQRLRGESGKFSLVHADRKFLTLRREIWSDWWIKQEKTRIRRDVFQYLRLGNRLIGDVDAMPTHLTQEIFDGVSKRPYPAGEDPTEVGIEVGVFVITRNS